MKMHPYIRHPGGGHSHPGIKHPHSSQVITWTVPELAAAYQLPQGQPGTGTIGIVELAGGWNQADVASAFQFMGLAAPSITDVSVDGTTNKPGNDADGEVALDIQVAAGIFTYMTGRPANVRIYWCQNMQDGVAAAAKDGCAVFSISWGADEAEWGSQALIAMEAACRDALASGMIITAATGDNDSADGGQGRTNVDGPSVCPSVLGCGGTSKPKQGSETVWNNQPGQSNGHGTGGGFSTVFPRPIWQSGCPLPPHASLGRMIPDIGGNADPDTGWLIVLNGQTIPVGGTSAVAPMWAGILAALGAKGDLHQVIYSAPGAFQDIVAGDNGAYFARPGPDACTGMGSPNGPGIAVLAGTASA